MPFLELVYTAASVHRLYHDPRQVRNNKIWRLGRDGWLGTTLHVVEYKDWWLS